MTDTAQHGGARRGAGRPAGSKNRVTADIKALAQTYGPDAIDILADIMKNESAPETARIAAAKELIDRGFGRAVQTVQNTGPDGGPLQFAEITQAKFGEIARETAQKV